MSNIVHSQAPSAADVLTHVARNLRELRQAAGLSQQQVADRAGLSRRMIVGLEGGETNISLAKLSRVADALGVGFGRIVGVPGATTPQAVWRGRSAGTRAMLLGTVPCVREAEFWSWAIAPGERYVAEPDPAGYREAVLVIEGTLSLELAAGVEEVAAGGFAVYRSDQDYSYVNRAAEPLRFMRAVLV